VIQYTDRKVHRPLADKLGDRTPRTADIARFSLQTSAGGIAAQRAAHFSTYRSDPDIAKISQVPEEAWDHTRPTIGAQHGIVWISMSDLHHDAVGAKVVAGVVHMGDTIFVSVTMSSTLQHIKRVDGDDLNGTTQLILSILNHFPSLKQIRFTEDTTRANREDVGWSQITTKCKVRAINMVFGGQCYDPTDKGGALALGALGLVGGQDDPTRRRRLSGKRLLKIKAGGAAIAEDQMPLGWQHMKDMYGRPVVDGDRGLVPEADSTLIPVLKTLYGAHADGENYQRLADRLITFEAEGLLRRRDHKNLDNTYAAMADDPLASYDAAKGVFVLANHRPDVPPNEDAIVRYLEGAAPDEVFDADTQRFIAKVELVRTGRYFRRLQNDIRGRNIVLEGIPAQYKDDLDEFGWYDVLSAPWGWPTNDTGAEVPSFGISDQTCRQVAARLLRELRAPRSSSGGRGHQQATRRAIQCFDNWQTPPGTTGARYEDEPTEWGIEARQNNSGSANFILLHRRASVTTNGRRGWSNLGPGESKPNHIAATGSLSDLCASVAWNLDHQVRSLLDHETLATVTELRDADDDEPDPTVGWKAKIELKQAQAERLDTEARGHRALAAVMAAKDKPHQADLHSLDAESATAEAERIRTEISGLESKIELHRDGPDATARPDMADVSVAACLVAGLEEASRSNGHAPAPLGRLADDTFKTWRFEVHGDDLAWSCDASLPLASGATALLPLEGVICNVRTRPGKALANTATVIRYLFEEGRDLTAIAGVLDVTRKTLLVKRVMPWLVENGVTARGAKSALVDHPFPSVRRELFHAITVAPEAAPTLLSPYRVRVRATYLDPDLSWGDAAVPDDTTWIARAAELLTANADVKRDGLPVLDLALELGRTEADLRELVKPQHRSGGFTRPAFLKFADEAKTHVKVIGCPHGKCKGRRYAEHVVLLPEVAASGFGVICRSCRRTPALSDAWPLTQFPTEYLQHWTKRGPGGSLREASQTVPVDAPELPR
jgi:hypothetical protein